MTCSPTAVQYVKLYATLSKGKLLSAGLVPLVHILFPDLTITSMELESFFKRKKYFFSRDVLKSDQIVDLDTKKIPSLRGIFPSTQNIASQFYQVKF